MLPNLCHIQGEKACQLIANRHGVSELAGITKDKLILFKLILSFSPVNYIISFLCAKFDKGLQYRNLNSLRFAISTYHVHIDGKSDGKFCSILGLTGRTIHHLLTQT